MDWRDIELAISSTTGDAFNVVDARPVGGGSINSAFVLHGADEKYFVKLNARQYLDMFSAESAGLAELAQSNAIRVPRCICCGVSSSQAFIVMENISTSKADKLSDLKFGESLAMLHQYRGNSFGWYRDNTIGTTPQLNKKNNNWVDFFREQRLHYQLFLAHENGGGRELKTLGDKLCDNLEVFFTSHTPVPSLLHGDLWSGNYCYDEYANPVIYDPATYYGDREADLAMTELFGGFSKQFYEAYLDSHPLDDGYEIRKILYNLYHILNHFNLFGGGYRHQSVDMIKRLLAEL